MNSKLTKLAAAGALSFCTAVPALAASVTQPGETVGLNAGAPLPQGWYAINPCSCRSGKRELTKSALVPIQTRWLLSDNDPPCRQTCRTSKRSH
jgi:hypothetical protein